MTPRNAFAAAVLFVAGWLAGMGAVYLLAEAWPAQQEERHDAD